MKIRLLAIIISATIFVVFCGKSIAWPPNQSPTAILAVDPNHITCGKSILLDAGSSYDSDSGDSIDRCEWDFNYDGSTFHCDYYETSGYHPDGSFDKKTTYTYDSNSTYTVALRVRDNHGAISVVNTETVYVYKIHNLNKKTGYSAIQAAIIDATNGDVIEIAKGTYYEKNINFGGKKIHVRSIDPNDPNVVASTSINADDKNNPSTIVVKFCSGEDSNSILEGVTVKRGYVGIYCWNGSSPLITKCVVRENYSCGIYASDSASNPTISYCSVLNNSYDGFQGLKATLRNSIFAKNARWGIHGFATNTVSVTNCTIFGNSQRGVSNTAGQIKNCIIWGNGDDLDNSSATYSCIKDPDSCEGNIHRKPMFINEDVNDFNLYYSSPCIDAGDPNSAWFNEPDYDPNDPNDHIDMGAYGNTSEATPRTDKDVDKMADEWELENGLDPNDDSDAMQHHDNDGLRNIDEYYSNMDPNHDDSNSIDGLVHNNVLDINFPSVGLAIDWAESSETLILGQGTYYETNVNFNGKKIHVRSTNPTDPNVVEATIIDANGGTSVIVFDSREDADSILDGITVGGGSSGITCQNSSPLIKNCRIVNNTYAGYRDTSSAAPYSSPAITDCNISNNWNGILCNNGGPTISNCRITRNGLYGVRVWGGPDPGTINNCVIARNQYGITGHLFRVFNCTIAYNIGYGIDGAHAVAKNCIFWGNGGTDFTGRLIAYSCTEDGIAGWGNLKTDPAFVKAAANDFHLSSWSRCIDAGDPNSDWSNEPGHPAGHIDMGAYGNTSEASTQTDIDGDGLADEWEQHYWSDLEPNQVDPNGNLDGDSFSNRIEYLFGYDPNTTTTAPMTVIPFLSDVQQEEYIPFAWEETRIDPTQDQTATIGYYINMNADVNASFYKTNDSVNAVRTINQTATAGVINNVVWDGKNGSGNAVEKSFYDVKINASDGQGHNTSWISPDGGNTLTGDTLYDAHAYPAVPTLDETDFDPYKNIPITIQFTVNNWAILGVDIVKKDKADDRQALRDTDKYRICHLVKNRFFSAGEQVLHWNGRWGADVNDPNSGPDRKICQEAYALYFVDPVGVNRGSVLVYYEDLLSNLKCNPYRVIPVHNEITTITYDLAYDANVTIDIYDPDGVYFRRLLDSEAQTQGTQEAVWDGRDDGGECPSKEGVYLIEVKIDITNEKLQGAVMVYR